MPWQRVLCFIFVFSLVFSLCACQKSPPDPFAFTSRNFTAEIRGTTGDFSFCMTLSVENCEGGRLCRLRFSSPEAFDGLEIALLCTLDGSPDGKAMLTTKENTVYEVDANAVEGLCLPALTLLHEYETRSLQKVEQGYLFACSDGCERLFSKEGTPLSLRGERFSWDVTWMELS